MPDMRELLKKPAGQAKKPEALPIGDYHAIIKSFEIGDNNKNKTPYVRFIIGLMAYPDSVSEDERHTDLSKRTLRRDYYLTDDALFRLDDLIKGLGMQQEGASYEEIIPTLVGAQVMAEVQQYVNDKVNPPEIGNQIGKLVPAS